MSNARIGLLLVFLFMISGCSDDARVEPIPVLANAGTDRFVALGSTVVLDCKASSGPGPGTCAWSFVVTPATSQTVLQAPTTQTAMFVADVEGLYRVELAYTVNGITAKTGVSVFSVQRPEVSVSPDLAVSVGQTAVVEATATGSGDALTYAWTLTVKPAGSAASLTGADKATASFVADVIGTYVADVVVADRNVAADPVPVTVTCGPAAARAAPREASLRALAQTTRWVPSRYARHPLGDDDRLHVHELVDADRAELAAPP